jgi:flagellar capping protein FliD
LKVSGKKGGDLTFAADFSSDSQKFVFDGEITLLGLTEGLYINLSRNGIDFEFSTSIFGHLTLDIQAKSTGDISKPESLEFELSAELNSDIISYFTRLVTNKIDSAIKNFDVQIDTAKAAVEAAEKVYEAKFNELNTKLNDAQKDYEKCVARYR